MPINTLDFNALVTNQVTAIQSQLSNIQFPVGSVNLSIVESNAGVGLWLQAIVLQLAALTRSGSCTGSDLDSFFEIYGYFRNSSQKSSGLCTFSRNTNTNQAVVPTGGLVQTSSTPTIQFTVYADPSNPNYSIPLNGYVLLPGTSSIQVPVIAVVGGSSGNVNAGAINQIASSMVGIDNVDNTQPFTNGYDVQSDNSYRQGFIPFINSRSLGTLLAFQTAITNGTPSIFYNIVENKNSIGGTQLGFVSIFIDDGSGNPPTSLINDIYQKVDAVRALAIQIGVYPVVVLTANLVVEVAINPLSDSTTIINEIKDAVGFYIGGLEIGQTVIITKLYQIIYNVDPNIIEVTVLTINGSTSDLLVDFNKRAYIGTFTVTTT